MDRTLFSEQHQAFRAAFRAFIAREVTPHQARWREQGQVDRAAWRKAGAQGFLCPWLEEAHGGAVPVPHRGDAHLVVLAELQRN
jgi:acyl-CoA dehydrogenase